jgi:hypothetical protein
VRIILWGSLGCSLRSLCVLDRGMLAKNALAYYGEKQLPDELAPQRKPVSRVWLDTTRLADLRIFQEITHQSSAKIS